MIYEFRRTSGLEFTGNWFVDSGILGFIFIIEDIYGFDIHKIREISENEKLLYYGLFPFAYLCSEINRKSKSRVSSELINEFIKALFDSEFDSPDEIFEFTWNSYITRAAMDLWIENKTESTIFKKKVPDKLPDDVKNLALKVKELEKNLIDNNSEELGEIFKRKFKGFKFDDIDRIFSVPDENLREISEEFSESFRDYKDHLLRFRELLKGMWLRDVIGTSSIPEDLDSFYRIPIDNKFYKNFVFFQQSTTHQKQKQGLFDIISFRVDDLDVLRRVDKTINKFLTSYKKAKNTYYTPLTSKHLKGFSKYLFVYLISFDRAFEFFNRLGYVLFYSNDIEITYRVNKKLRLRKSKIEENSVLMRVTWQEIIDSLIELKSSWALENMYIIKYRDVNSQTQRFVDVEYIGISKIHASILLDDVIRDAINYNLHVSQSEYRWLLENLIQNKPLKPLIMRHIILRANRKTGQMGIKPLLYSLAIDSEIFSRKEPEVFNDPLQISARMDEIVLRIKETYREMNTARRNIQELIPPGTRENNINQLISILRRNNRYLFVNNLLKILIQENAAFHSLKNYLFNRILQNDDTWDIYAAALLTGFLGGR
ncbi:hypothetical protein [Methanothermobacter thermautotrophicus]|jgi:hypothetical protein|uniref:Uncharacterized protein n=1 Tax=Methanothermobacter thermautotrophicus (strain ATCC 29096 / DSM 1053 / JCM 10044 / NBRC 100330 / Delta H) TaxID=187420 RepID=O27162_METTH|nr:hypothetical protein [Methanothermobacter thermautotrophicus]AAB85579.1 unknown [Methanothermobacter thermautotrophicus str. Delta H]MDN5374344.1 hypothetical protein [Methanothermobacter sp.]WBF05658.1 hypothetical protein ISG35_05175 [Methanothermobacter thermautotrophicus]